jgi:uncharacterized membrane protein YhhN
MFTAAEYLYFIVGALEIAAEVTGNETLKFFTKPLLMIALIFFYARRMPQPANKVYRLMIAAFAFSWLGDVFLMFASASPGEGALMGITKSPDYFLKGLVGFLVAHILYTISFAEVSDKQSTPLLPRKFWVLTPLVIYMVGLLWFVLPSAYHNPATKLFVPPVVVYSVAIATMVVFSINRFNRVNRQSFNLVFGGALLFMFSDSLIAINKFLQPFSYAGVAIMLLYIAGQYLIAKGSIAQFAREE